jgi:hypothetical protein
MSKSRALLALMARKQPTALFAFIMRPKSMPIANAIPEHLAIRERRLVITKSGLLGTELSQNVQMAPVMMEMKLLIMTVTNLKTINRPAVLSRNLLIRLWIVAKQTYYRKLRQNKIQTDAYNIAF